MTSLRFRRHRRYILRTRDVSSGSAVSPRRMRACIVPLARNLLVFILFRCARRHLDEVAPRFHNERVGTNFLGRGDLAVDVGGELVARDRVELGEGFVVDRERVRLGCVVVFTRFRFRCCAVAKKQNTKTLQCLQQITFFFPVFYLSHLRSCGVSSSCIDCVSLATELASPSPFL